MPEPQPQPQPARPSSGPRIAIGAADAFPVVLIETTSALGVLVAQKGCPGETLERVLYFRSLMGRPYARFFDTVELLTIDGFSVARAPAEDSLFLEPSVIPYAISNFTPSQYQNFVDSVVAYRCRHAELLITSLFATTTEGFSLGPGLSLCAPADYAAAMDYFLGSHTFIDPHEPTGPAPP